jgi:hypothetical protein
MDRAKNESERSIYFGIAIWGRDFCQKFLDNCLASLLAKGNIPALPNSGQNKFIFCTTPEDWEWFQAQPLFVILSQHLTPEFMPIQMTLEGQDENAKATMIPKFQIVTQAHARLVSRMYQDKAIGSLIFPDTLYSSDSFKTVFPRILKKEVKGVVACVPRLSTPVLLTELAEQGYIKPGEPTELPNRKLVHYALKHMNTEMLAQNWKSLYAFDFITDIWLPLQKELTQGIVTHSFAWCPILLDYSKLSSHNVQCLENNTIDGAYLYSNFKLEELYRITDSDEFLMISYSPHTGLRLKEKFPPLKSSIHTIKQVNYWRKMIGHSLGGFVDQLKLGLLQSTIYMHTADLTESDYEQGAESNKIISLILNKPQFLERFLTFLYWNRISRKLLALRAPKISLELTFADKLISEHAL